MSEKMDQHQKVLGILDQLLADGYDGAQNKRFTDAYRNIVGGV